MIIATFTFASMNVLVKLLPHIPAVEIILFRSIVSFVVSYGMLKAQNVSVWGNNRTLLILRGTTGAIALIMFFNLLQNVPLATASTIAYMAPIFTSIIGIILLKEKVWPLQWLFFAIAFGGVLIIQGFDTRISFDYLLIGVGSTFFMGLAYNLIRKMKTSEHPLVIIFYFPLVTIPIVGVMSAFNWVQPQGMDWVWLIGVGLLTQIAQFFMTKSYQREAVSKVSIINYTSIIYALLFGFVFFDETFNFITYCGMGLSITGVILNVIFKK